MDRFKYWFKFLNFHAFEMCSDDFFDRLPKRIIKSGVDIAFVDGLHTYDQALRDIENCLKILNENGFIVVHDCNPISFNGAYPVKKSISELDELIKSGVIKNWDGNWNGDVWKALIHIRLTHPELEVFTVDVDWGVGVIRRGLSTPLKNVTLSELAQADYYLLENNRAEFLNLKSPDYFEHFLEKV